MPPLGPKLESNEQGPHEPHEGGPDEEGPGEQGPGEDDTGEDDPGEEGPDEEDPDEEGFVEDLGGHNNQGQSSPSTFSLPMYDTFIETNDIDSTVQQYSELAEETTPQPESPTFRKTRTECFAEVLEIFRSNRLSPFDLMVEMLDDSKPRYSYYRTELYKAENRKLRHILDHIMSNPAGQKKLDSEILPHALGLICQKVTAEMDVVKSVEKLPGLNEITPEFINGWKVLGHQETAPILSRILLTAAESASAKGKNKIKSPTSVCIITLEICLSFLTKKHCRHVIS